VGNVGQWDDKNAHNFTFKETYSYMVASVHNDNVQTYSCTKLCVTNTINFTVLYCDSIVDKCGHVCVGRENYM